MLLASSDKYFGRLGELASVNFGHCWIHVIVFFSNSSQICIFLNWYTFLRITSHCSQLILFFSNSARICIILSGYTFLLLKFNISENTGKFLLCDLGTLTNSIYFNSQRGTLMNRFHIPIPIGWREFPTIFWSAYILNLVLCDLFFHLSGHSFYFHIKVHRISGNVTEGLKDIAWYSLIHKVIIVIIRGIKCRTCDYIVVQNIFKKLKQKM